LWFSVPGVVSAETTASAPHSAPTGLSHPAAPSTAHALEGFWLAREQEGDGATRSVIHLYLRQGRLHGRIVRTLDAQGREISPVCVRCAGENKGKPYSDIEFIRDLKPTPQGATDGTVLDLRPGSMQGLTANCDVILKGRDTAVLHGYLGPRWLGRSSTWQRLPD
jgi:hypothetical protein